MAIGRILARLDGTEDDKTVLHYAFRAAERFQAHIDAVHVQFDPRDLPLVTGYGPVVDLSGLVETMKRTAEEMAAKAQQHFAEWQETSNVPAPRSATGGQLSATWHQLEDRELDVMAYCGRLADLIVIARPNPETGASSQTALEAAIFETRRPVLMVPPQMNADLFYAPIIAWNGSAEAALAVQTGLPFLTAGDSIVRVFTAEESKHRGHAPDLIEYLRYHGVLAEQAQSDGIAEQVGERLLERAAAHRAGLIVMGAYTHGRMRQLVFGGVTRHVLQHADVPVLLAH